MGKFLLWLCLLLVLGTARQVSAQDALYTIRGEIIPCYVKEVNATDIIYEPTEGNSVGSKVIIPIGEVKRIVFENGLEQSFENTAPVEGPYPNGKQSKDQPDKVVLTNGEVLIGEVVEKKRFGITFIPKSLDGAPAEYIPNSKIARIEWGEGQVEYINPGKEESNPKNFDYLNPHFVSVATGVALPIASFGETQFSGLPPGFATAGWQIMGEATYYLYRGMGFSAMGGYILNPSNNQPYRDQIRNSFFSPSDSTASVSSLSEGVWQHSFVAGALGYYYESERFMLDSRWIVGALFSSYPVIEVEGTASGESFQSRVERRSSPSVMFGAAVTGRYFLTRKWQLRFGFQFLTSTRTFDAPKEYKTLSDGTVQEGVLPLSINPRESFGVISLEVGAAYTLGK
jgi:hypothetical protein